jgi:hypothetical protein
MDGDIFKMQTILSFRSLLVFLGVLVTPNYCNCFSYRNTGNGAIASRQTTHFAAVERETLLFSAEFDLKSDSLPSNDSIVVSDFLRSPTLRDHFLSGGGRLKTEPIDWTPELENLWVDASERVYGINSLPRNKNDDKIISSVAIIKFPGLKLTNTVFTGSMLLEDIDGFPYYRNVMIADRRKVSGLPPAVWLFNKVTGANPEIEFNPVSGGVESTLSVCKDTNGDFAIRYVASVKIATHFPKKLMQILPASKEKMEEQGSFSIRKAIEKDILHCRDTVIEHFESWQGIHPNPHVS